MKRETEDERGRERERNKDREIKKILKVPKGVRYSRRNVAKIVMISSIV